MRHHRVLAAALAGLVLLAVPAGGAKRIRKWYERVDQPLQMFHWRGPGTGTAGCAKPMSTCPGDTVRAPEQPTLADLHDLRNADVVYLRNHGGCLQTYGEGDQWKDRTYLLGAKPGTKPPPGKTIQLPITEDSGPSVVLAWGCENGTSPRHGERFPNALGIRCDSKTKAYIAPKDSVQGQGDRATFECVFFEEFAKGDVSVSEAASIAYRRLRESSYSPAAYPTDWRDFIDICGNVDLTLDDVRENVQKRHRAPPVASPAPPVAPDGRATHGLTTTSKTTGRYCTNAPRFQTRVPVSAVVTRERAAPKAPRAH